MLVMIGSQVNSHAVVVYNHQWLTCRKGICVRFVLHLTWGFQFRFCLKSSPPKLQFPPPPPPPPPPPRNLEIENGFVTGIKQQFFFPD